MPQVELIPAVPEQQPVLANLLELYAHDFSDFLQLELSEDGRFGYSHLPEYWSEPDHYPFLIRADGKLAGFVLVQRKSDAWDVAEFFVVRAYRRHGVGTQAAHQLWKQFPGIWQVRVRTANASALRFWTASISAFVGHEAEPARIDPEWRVFSFTSVNI